MDLSSRLPSDSVDIGFDRVHPNVHTVALGELDLLKMLKHFGAIVQALRGWLKALHRIFKPKKAPEQETV